MKSLKFLTFLFFLPAVASANDTEAGGNTAYVAGALIALLILVYLIYSLLKPEKF